MFLVKSKLCLHPDHVFSLPQAPPKGPMNNYDPAFSDEFLAPEYGGYITGDSRANKGLPRGAAPPPRGMRGGMGGAMAMRGGRMSVTLFTVPLCRGKITWLFASSKKINYFVHMLMLGLILL